MSNLFWGTLTAVIGLLIFLAAEFKSEFILYQLLEARARILWKSWARAFLLSVGALLLIVGILWASGLIWTPK